MCLLYNSTTNAKCSCLIFCCLSLKRKNCVFVYLCLCHQNRQYSFVQSALCLEPEIEIFKRRWFFYLDYTKAVVAADFKIEDWYLTQEISYKIMRNRDGKIWKFLNIKSKNSFTNTQLQKHLSCCKEQTNRHT